MDNPKAAKLIKHFGAIISGKLPLTPQNNPLFLEAVYTSPDPAGYVDSIINSPKGLSSLQSSLRMDMSTSFLNNTAAKVVETIAAPEVSSISNGTYVQKVVTAIVEPPIFWGALLRAFKQGRMDLGVNFLIAKGYTGQTTEQLEPSLLMSIVGVRLRSYVSASYTYRFGTHHLN